MSKDIIKIIIVIVIVGFLGVTISFNSRKKEKPITTPIRTVNEIETSDLNDRQNRIDHVITTKGKDYPRYSLTKDSPKNLIITYYLYQLNYESFNKDRKLSRDRRGILVFEEKTQGNIKLIWESEDDINAYRSKTGMYDLTGDGINEIVALWDYDKVADIYIYKWNGSGFNMISPIENPDSKFHKFIVFNAESSLIKVFDIDKDGIPEIILPFNLGSTKNKEIYRAYKWNGLKYFLWKEQEKSFTPSTEEDEYSVINMLNPVSNN